MRKKEVVSIEAMGANKPPQAIEIEKAVLGVVLLIPDALIEAQGLITSNVFYVEQHKHIYSAIETLSSKSKEIDVLTVLEQLKAEGKYESGVTDLYLFELTNSVSGGQHLKQWCAILSEKYIAREFIKVSYNSLDIAYKDGVDIFEEISTAEISLMRITSEVLKKDVVSIKGLSDRLIENLKQPPVDILGISSGIYELDKVLGGFKDANLIIVAARPSVGKSVLAANFASYAAVHKGKTVALFSLEMSSDEFLTRIYASETSIPQYKLQGRQLDSVDWERINAFKDKISNAPLFIDDTPGITISELRAKSVRLKQKHDIGMIVIDYLQLMKGGGKYANREAEVSDISRSLKSLSKELKIPIIALAQLSRSVEQRADKRPILSDLRESGSIEMDADIVMFISRPELYEIPSASINGKEYPTENLALLEVAKHRNGGLASIPLRFHKSISKMTSYDTSYDSINPIPNESMPTLDTSNKFDIFGK